MKLKYSHKSTMTFNASTILLSILFHISVKLSFTHSSVQGLIKRQCVPLMDTIISFHLIFHKPSSHQLDHKSTELPDSLIKQHKHYALKIVNIYGARVGPHPCHSHWADYWCSQGRTPATLSSRPHSLSLLSPQQSWRETSQPGRRKQYVYLLIKPPKQWKFFHSSDMKLGMYKKIS